MRRFTLTICLTMAALGCRIAYYPPPSAQRTDGGPVVSRGVVSHEARSQLRLYRDAAGCEAVQTANRQFRLVTVSGPRHIVLEESYDVRHCLTSEGTSSEAIVTAWAPDSTATTPLFRITGRGVAGQPAGNLYRMVSLGCCGSQDASTYYSLLTGNTLFTSSITPLRVESNAGRSVRFVALHDTYSSIPVPEAQHDSSLIAVLQYGDDQVQSRRIGIILPSAKEPFAAASLQVLIAGEPPSADSIVVMNDRSSERYTIRATLVAPGSDRRLWIEVPIEGDSLLLKRVRASAPVRLKPL